MQKYEHTLLKEHIQVGQYRQKVLFAYIVLCVLYIIIVTVAVRHVSVVALRTLGTSYIPQL